MAFEFKISTDEIREKMFDFIKPDYMDKQINWTYGVYDEKSGFFITQVKNGVYDKYVLITKDGESFYVAFRSYKIHEIPEELEKYSEVIKEGVKIYSNSTQIDHFKDSLSDEQKKRFDEITENMQDKCKMSFDINCYEDAVKLYNQMDCQYYAIKNTYNKNTVASLDKYMSEEKMRALKEERYKLFISKVLTYNDKLSEEEYKEISTDFHKAAYWVVNGIDDMHTELTLEAIKKAYFCGVISVGYTSFIESYIEKYIKDFPDEVQNLRAILDFINKNMRSENFERLEFYRKELDKLIYNRVEGFQFVCTTDETREKILGFIKLSEDAIYGIRFNNINWTTGVYDKESGIFLTLIEYVPNVISRTEVDFYSYIAITDEGDTFKVENNYEFEKRRYDFRIPKQYNALADKVKEGINFYRQCRFVYTSGMINNKVEDFKVIKDLMYDRCLKDYPINCEEDAHRLFEQVRFNEYLLRKTYNKKTISDFDRFTTSEKLALWKKNGKK